MIFQHKNSLDYCIALHKNHQREQHIFWQKLGYTGENEEMTGGEGRLDLKSGVAATVVAVDVVVEEVVVEVDVGVYCIVVEEVDVKI